MIGTRILKEKEEGKKEPPPYALRKKKEVAGDPCIPAGGKKGEKVCSSSAKTRREGKGACLIKERGGKREAPRSRFQKKPRRF